MQKLAFLEEIPTWENQIFTVRNCDQEDGILQLPSSVLARGHCLMIPLGYLRKDSLSEKISILVNIPVSFLAWMSADLIAGADEDNEGESETRTIGRMWPLEATQMGAEFANAQASTICLRLLKTKTQTTCV